MANIQVVCPVVPDSNFTYEAGQTRYTEQLSFVLLHNIALAAGAGISVQYIASLLLPRLYLVIYIILDIA